MNNDYVDIDIKCDGITLEKVYLVLLWDKAYKYVKNKNESHNNWTNKKSW